MPHANPRRRGTLGCKLLLGGIGGAVAPFLLTAVWMATVNWSNERNMQREIEERTARGESYDAVMADVVHKYDDSLGFMMFAMFVLPFVMLAGGIAGILVVAAWDCHYGCTPPDSVLLRALEEDALPQNDRTWS